MHSFDSDVYEGAVWDYLNTGIDPFLDFNGSEMISAQSPLFYHGYLAIETGTAFNVDLLSAPTSTQIDLYSLILPEVFQILGVDSYMNGQETESELGLFGSNIYSKYDQFLAKDDVYLLSLNGCYENTVEPGITSYTPFCSGGVLVDGAIFFKGNNIELPIYSSTGVAYDTYDLEHIYIYISCLTNGIHYVTQADNLNLGITRRLPLQEEVDMLCDLGYETNIVYGNPAYPLNYHFGYEICGKALAGADDFFEVTHNDEFAFNATQLLANDNSIDGLIKVSCLESLDGIPIIEFPDNSGNFKMDIPEVWGKKYFLLRYKPENIEGRLGNTTTVVLSTEGYSICDAPNQDECNLLCGGNFEDSNVGFMPYDHWDIQGNAFSGSNYIFQHSFAANGTTTSGCFRTSTSDGDISPGLYLPFKEALSEGTQYRLSFEAHNNFPETGTVYLMGSNTVPCASTTGIFNDLDAIGGTDCGDGTNFSPVPLANYDIPQDVDDPATTSIVEMWLNNELIFEATDDFEYLIIYVENSETENLDILIDEIFVEPYINEFPAGEDVLICEDGEGIIIGVPGLDGFPEGTIFNWTPTTGLSDPNIGNPIASPTSTTTYTLGINMGECGLFGDQVEVVVTENCCDVLSGDFDFNNKTATDVIAEYNGGVADFTSIAPQSVKINTVFTVDTDISFDNFLFEMGENASIVFDGGFGTKKLKISNSVLEACGDAMWTGIVLNEDLEKIEMDNTEIRDAQNAIQISNCAKYDIYFDNTFHANFRDISVVNCNLPVAEEDHRIEKNFFTSEPLLLEPYADGTVADFAIWANDIVELKVTLNRIDDYPHPVFIRNSDLTMEDNTINYDPLLGTGNYAVGLSMHTSGKTLFSYKDDINNYNYGISNFISGLESSKGIHLDIVDDTFSDIVRRAIDIRRLASVNHNQVLNNNFNNVAIGIVIQEIFPSGPSLFEPEDLTVANNTMTGIGQKGMWFTNLYSGTGASGIYEEVRIENNSQISMAPYGAGTQAAIQVEKCRRIVVDNNTMSRADLAISPAAYDFVRGLSVADTEGGRFTNNNSTNMGSGIHVLGQNHFSQWECNELDYCYRGFYFDQDNAVISDQGTIYNPTDNQWVDRLTGYSQRVDGGLDLDLLLENPKKWHYRNLPSYGVVLSPTAIFYFQPIPLGDTAAYCDGSAPSGGSGGIAGMSLDEGLDALESLSNGSSSYETYNETYQYRDQEMVYRTMEASPALQGERVALDNFFIALENSGIATNLAIQKDMETAEIEAALARNESWLTENVYESHSKTVNGIYLNSIAVEENLSLTDKESLENIALTTPYLSGDAVYSARVILGIDAGESGIVYRLSESATNQSEPHWYPNPTQGTISIRFENHAQQSRKMYCYDFTGKLLYQKSLSLYNNLIDMDLSHFPSGIYFIEVEQDNQSIIFDKLIVTD